MKKLLFGICTFVIMLLVAGPAIAQTYDIANYMLLTPGAWQTERATDAFSGTFWDEGTLIGTYGIYTLASEYDIVGGNWIAAHAEVFQITPRNFIVRGDYDYVDESLCLFQPPMTFPRSLAVGQVVVNTGVESEGGATYVYSHTFMIKQAGVSITTPAGTFNNCLKIMETEIVRDEVWCAIEILAPGVGSVKRWETDISEEGSSINMYPITTVLTGYGLP